MTADTPMIMPSIVSAVRILFLPSALSATRSVIRMDMSHRSGFFLFWNEILEFVRGVQPIRHGLVDHDVAIAEGDDAGAVVGDVHFMRDEQHRDAALDIQLLKQPHDLDARARVE